MALTIDIRKGMYIDFEGEPHIITEREFYSPGKGSAFHRCKLKNIKTGKIFPHIFKSQEKVDELTLETKNMQFLYSDDSTAYFMDPITFDQVSVSLDMIKGRTDYLHVDGKYIIMFNEGKALTVELPSKIALRVVEANEGVKGNSVSGASKEVKIETGIKVFVPLFIKEGDVILINTNTNEYFSKEN